MSGSFSGTPTREDVEFCLFVETWFDQHNDIPGIRRGATGTCTGDAEWYRATYPWLYDKFIARKAFRRITGGTT